jgi:hypothetical protein
MTERDDPGGAVEPSASPAPYGDNGFLEDYTAQVRSAPIGRAVLVTSNSAGQTQHIAANYRPRSSLLLMSAEYFLTRGARPPVPPETSPEPHQTPCFGVSRSHRIPLNRVPGGGSVRDR